MKKILLSALTLLTISTGVNAQDVTIPDATFKAYVVGDPSINTNGDSEIQVSEAASFSGSLFLYILGITDLTGIEAFTALTELNCGENYTLGTLDVSQNTALTSLKCVSTGLTSLDVSQNTALTTLWCTSNSISTLDLSGNPNLTDFACNNNALTALNVANGNNSNFTAFYATLNSNLTCITVDDATYSTANWTNIDPQTSFSLSCTPCTVAIPDANFKAYLVGNAAINTNADTEIQCTEASAFTGAIFANNLSISDLTGIEAFTSLGGLHCNNNTITTIDISSNTLLQALQCNENQLTSISTVNNPMLIQFYCHTNLITSLDLSTNTNLQYVSCYNNQISTISLPQSSTLEEIVASDNNLTAIDVSFNTGLEVLSLNQNQISTIDLSQNTALESLYLRNNLFTSLDCSNNSALDWIVVNDNPNIESMNVANGNNTNFGFFWAHNSPLLTCIQVDDVAYSTSNWTSSSFDFDAASSFNLNCTVVVLVNSISVQGLGGVSTITTPGGTLQMEADVLPANADDATYTWSVTNGTGSASIDASGLLTSITDGTVDVIATANDGSGVTGMATITISNQNVGIDEVTLTEIKLYPNPVQNKLFIDFGQNKVIQIEVLNVSGQVVQSIMNNNVKSIDVSSLNQGIFILKVQTENGISTNRFIKN
jgi:Leucine-rich repeat (LRR) protein